MDVDKIIHLLNSCIKKVLSEELLGKPLEKAYAYEFAFILIGERVNEILNEVEKFLVTNRQLFVDLIRRSNIEFDQSTLEMSQNSHYMKSLFRRSFVVTPIGDSLIMLSRLRSKLEHQLFKLSEAEHLQFHDFNFDALFISNFLDAVRKLCNYHKDDSAALVTNLFASKIPPINFDKLNGINILSEVSKKIKKDRVFSFEEQKEKIQGKIQKMSDLFFFLETYQLKCASEPNFKNVTLLYSTSLHLIQLGESAKTLLQWKKNLRFDIRFHECLAKHQALLSDFSYMSTRLAHATTLPNYGSVLGLTNSCLAKKDLISTLMFEISRLSIPQISSTMVESPAVSSSAPSSPTTSPKKEDRKTKRVEEDENEYKSQHKSKRLKKD